MYRDYPLASSRGKAAGAGQIRRYRVLAVATVFCLTALFCCAAVGNQYTESNQQPAQPDAVLTTLKDRATAYWQARVTGDLVTTYEYEADNVTGALSLSQYVRKKGGIIYKRAKVLTTEVVGKNKAVAHLIVEAVVPGLPGILKSEFKDEWVFIDGLWYHSSDRYKVDA